jgi:hypothetical protein
MTSYMPRNANAASQRRTIFLGVCARLVVLAAVTAMTAGCSHHPAATVASEGSTWLSCRDSAGQQSADPQAHPLNGVESFALHGDTNPYDTLPQWRSNGPRYLIWKAYLAVSPNARPYRIVTVTSPATARLFYASPTRWGAVSGSKTIGPAPWRVRLPVCGTRFTGYTGGILITHPACVILTVTGPQTRAVTIAVPILVSQCRPHER